MPAARPAEALTVKGFVLRAYVAELKRLGLVGAIADKVDPDVRAALHDPPPGSTWLPSRYAEQLGEAISQAYGHDRWRKISHDATLNNMVPVLRVVIEGFIRLFGATPSSLLTRLTRITSTSARGIEYAWDAATPRSGVLTIRYPERRDVPLSTFYCCAGGVDTIFDICRTPGTLSAPKMIADGRSNAATIDINW